MGIGGHLQKDRSKTFEVKLDEETQIVSEYQPLDSSYEASFAELQHSKAFVEGHERVQKLRGLITPPQQAPSVEAPHQPVAPVQAPPEQSWKERRKEQSAIKKELKAGRKLTRHANEYTARIAQTQQQLWASQPDPAEPQPALIQTCRQVANPKITPEMFVGKAFMLHQRQIANHLEAISRLKTVLSQDARAMEGLEQQDPIFARSVQRGLEMEAHLLSLYSTALGAHGVQRDGGGIKENMDMEALKRELTMQVDSLRDRQRENQEQHQADMEAEVEQRMLQHDQAIQQSDRVKTPQVHEQHPATSWITEDLGSENIYLGIEKQRRRLEKNPGAYLEHQQVLDKLLGDYIHSAQAYARLKQRTFAYDEVSTDMRIATQERSLEDANAMSRIAAKKVNVLADETPPLLENMELLEGAIIALLEGKMTQKAEITLAKYDPDQLKIEEHLGELGHAYRKRMATAGATLSRLLKERPELKGLDMNTVAVARSIVFHSENDDEYVKTILLLVQGQKERAQPKSTWETYFATKKLVTPTVEGVFGLDIEGYLAMSDAELMEHVIELERLNTRTMYAADCMKLPHPEHASPCTLQSELLGNRTEEFSYRLTFLRGLFEKARCLAIKQMLYRDTDIDACLQGSAELTTRGDKEMQMAFFTERLGKAQNMIDTGLAKRKAVETPGTPEFIKRAQDILTVSPVRIIPNMSDAANDYSTAQKIIMGHDDSAEAKTIERRLRLSHYCLAGWTKAEGEEKGIIVEGKPVSSINEPVFRTITSYLATKAGRTQTEEQFIQMMRDLAAGDGMEYGVTPAAELQAAREQNMRGLLEYKETMRLHYDYMAKKYGTKLETISIQELVQHYDDIQRDIANEQTFSNIACKVPGLFDLENEEDKILFHKSVYYANLGHYVNALLIGNVRGKQSEEELHQTYKTLMEQPGENADSRNFVLANAERLGLNLTGNINHQQAIGERRVIQPTEGGSN